MNILEQTIQFLKKPFPDEDDWYSYFKYLILVSLFVTFFLFVFQPFGISEIESDKFLICLGFGCMTFLGSLVYDLTIVPLQKLLGLRKNWTFGKWMINNLGIMFFISLANFLFARIFIFGYIEWSLFPVMIYGTFMIGLIPFSVLGGINLMKQERKYQSIAQEINQNKIPNSNPITHQNISIFDIPIHQIKYVEALQNYIKIGFVNPRGKLMEQVERATLKKVLEETKGSAIVKCHRSFLVNRDAIVSTSGNAQGLLLSLSECEKIIPVSRSCVPQFK